MFNPRSNNIGFLLDFNWIIAGVPKLGFVEEKTSVKKNIWDPRKKF
jgi:hypothetical protein